MNTATVCFITLWMFLAFTEAVKECPHVPCPLMLISPICRSATFFEHDGQICQGCDMCVQTLTTQLVVDGCPLPNCNKKEIPDNCKREIYYIYLGGKVCKDCPLNTCKE